jgi:hypothetical protein
VGLSFLGIHYQLAMVRLLSDSIYRGPDSEFFWIYRIDSDFTSGRSVDDPSPDRRVSIA